MGQPALAEAVQHASTRTRGTLLRSVHESQLSVAAELLQAALAAESAPPEPIEPILDSDVVTFDARLPQDDAAWTRAGLGLLATGAVAVLTLAGGQGTRLGSTDPKGMFDIGLPSGKCLFQLHAERLLRLQQLAVMQRAGTDTGGRGGAPPGRNGTAYSRAPVPLIYWYIMTSAATHAATVAHFAAARWHGLRRDQIVFFQQGSLPCLTETGEAVVQEGGVVATAPDGNGGVYEALASSGALRHMRRRGICCVDCFAVDNAAARAGDPLFVGACWSLGAAVGCRTVARSAPGEKVGVFARQVAPGGGGGSSGSGCGCGIRVVEYSELGAREAAAAAHGRLRHRWGNVCMHYFDVRWLEAAAGRMRAERRYHIARKQIPSADGLVAGIKLEQFIFDAFPSAPRCVLVEVSRSEEFAPVKNANGGAAADTPRAAAATVMAMHRRWVERAGGRVDAPPGEGLEVSPLLSYAGEGLERRCRGEVFRAREHVV